MNLPQIHNQTLNPAEHLYDHKHLSLTFLFLQRPSVITQTDQKVPIQNIQIKTLFTSERITDLFTSQWQSQRFQAWLI